MPEIDQSSDQVDLPPSGREPDRIDPLTSWQRVEAEPDLIEPLPESQQVRDEAPAASWVAGGPALARTSDVLGAINALNDQLARRLELLQMTFERELRAEATRERVVDRLHAELQDYKQDLLLKVQRPIFIDLIQLHDDIGKMIDARIDPGPNSEQSTEVRGFLEPIQTAIEDILYRQGVEPFSLEGTEFDPRKQRAASTQATDDPALNKKIAWRLRKGFCSGDKLIRPEIVTVFTYRAAPADASR